MKSILFALIFVASTSFGQYIGVKARYTETRLVDDAPNPPKRENRLILSFFEVSPLGVYTPVSLSNYPIHIWKEGLQYGTTYSNVWDSAGNMYAGYTFTAPKAVAYYNSWGPEYIGCDLGYTTPYIANGFELDCGFITVSQWTDWGAGLFEFFTTPNISLPWYGWPHPYFMQPGNVNFDQTQVPPGCPYNWCNPPCGGLIIRGVLTQDTGSAPPPLPVKFAGVRGVLDNNIATIYFSNLTESNISSYYIERSTDASSYQTIGTVLPTKNNDDSANYQFQTLQTEDKAFYRIKAVETTGQVFYSTIVSLSRDMDPSNPIENNSTLRVYPNPVVGGNFTFNLSNAEKGRFISIVVSPEGRELRQRLIMHNGGDLTRSVDLSGLPAGIYQLVIRGERTKYSQKILYVR